MGIDDGATADANRPPPATIAGALNSASQSLVGSKPLEASDARAIQSAEARATGIPAGVKGGVGAAAQHAVDKGEPVTVGDVLRVSISLFVLFAAKSAEQRNNPDSVVSPGGVAASMQSAADHNKAAGYA
ncbi:late embryogenesis abundant protein 31-like [Selaginella moellendorffii]|uniref:late embryogenesis abundant protein 31-like n=1 Tax=Selaginella moellendorffii TaxID=88036 RepID=UPI000D1CEA8B|nr:late embryogenesis abundant protein 31-like [Selaginella moellendorffii]|eukprot:XP_024539083.1 late embryogenesis abundant protein 31-like [Selaginella moellendorffii]